MKYKGMLMQPFSPGRYKDRQGKTHFISDEAWSKAFPDCKYNGKFPEDVVPTDGGLERRILKIIDKRGERNDGTCC